jgi:PEP-CTERM motif
LCAATDFFRAGRIIFSGQVAAYGPGSPEFAVLETLGWNLSQSAVVPEPGTLALFGTSLLAVAALRRRIHNRL